MEEGEAIARLKRGDISGLEALVRLYQVEALEVAYLTTHSYELAEDVVQAAFLRTYERIHQFDSARPFRPWFLRSVVNSALTSVTNKHNISLEAYLAQEEVELPSPEPGLEEMLEAAETKQELLAALELLSPAQRAAVVMRYYFDWSDAEVSYKLEVPSGTIRRRLHDARRRLRHLLPTRAI